MKAEKMQLVFATNNDHKLREIRDILGDSFNLLSLKDLNIEEDIPENEPSKEMQCTKQDTFTEF
jgi:Xanthosine triphosphate pyrophosphatase